MMAMNPEFHEAFQEYLAGIAPLLPLILTLEETVSKLTEKLTELEQKQDAAIARVEEDVAAFRAEIDELKAQATTQADIDKLDAMGAKLDALDPTKPDTLPEEPPA